VASLDHYSAEILDPYRMYELRSGLRRLAHVFERWLGKGSLLARTFRTALRDRQALRQGPRSRIIVVYKRFNSQAARRQRFRRIYVIREIFWANSTPRLMRRMKGDPAWKRSGEASFDGLRLFEFEPVSRSPDGAPSA
jgi:hypothetical protein